jgi:CRP-like cAMP-binding protein
MLHHMLLMSMANMRMLIDAAEGLGIAEPTRRVSACLLRIDRGGPGWNGRLDLTQGELASIAKLSRRRTNAALRELEDAGALRIGYGELEILDREALNSVLEGAP